MTRFIFYTWLLFLLLAGEGISLAQYKFIRLNNEDGLSNNSVNCILEDSRGFMWFGTFDGLNKYDGYKFTYYKPVPGDSNTVCDYNIRCLYEDHLGFIWIGTDQGLSKYDPYANRFKNYIYKPNQKGSISHRQVTAIFQDQSAVMWIATADGKLNKLDKMTDRFVNFSLSGKIIHSIISISFQEQYRLYIGSTGVIVFNPVNGTFIPLLGDNDSSMLSHTQVMSMIENKNRLYIGTWRGLYIYDLQSKKIVFNSITKPGFLDNNIIQAMQIDQDGMLWLGSRGGGLYRLSPETMETQHFTKQPFYPYSISGDAITTIYQSRSGILWFGTNLEGVSKLSLQFGINKFSHFLPGNVVESIYEDDEERVWIGSRYKGLFQLNTRGEIIRNYNLFLPSDASLSSNTSQFILSDLSCRNCLLIATETDGILQFDKNTGKVKRFYNIAATQLVRDFRNGNIWAPTWGNGVYILDQRGKLLHHLQHSALDESIPVNVIPFICQTRNGEFWLGTKGYGVTRVFHEQDTFRYIHYRYEKNDSQSLSNSDVNFIYEDSNGEIWLGTGYGLNRFIPQTGKFRHYTTAQGLPSNIICAIQEDNMHNFWISTYNGLVKFNPRINGFTAYNITDGLQDKQFLSASAFRSTKGRLYFGGINGYNVFSPDSIKSNTRHVVPPLEITDFKVLRKGSSDYIASRQRMIYYYKRIVLPYQYNDFVIEFAAMDYIYPMRTRYAYILKGYDKEWITVDADHRFARYTNLSPGEYTFLVKSGFNDNLFNESGTNLTIIIKPPFWWSGWLIAVYIFLLTVLLIFIAYRIRQRILRHRKEYEETARETLFNKENQLRTLVDNLPDFIYIKDIHSRFILANRRLAHVMIGKGHSPDELIGKTDHDYYEKHLADRFFADEQNIIRSGEPLIGRIEPGLDENGEQRIINTTKVPVKNSRGEVIGLVGIGRDITDIKRAEQKIQEQAEHLQQTNTLLEERQEQIWQQKVEIEQQKEELEKLNLTKDKLFSIIGHDLKNPFHAIIGLTDALTKNSGEISEAEKDELIGMIKSSAQSAYELLENLLQWSRAQTGRLQFHPEKVNVKEIIDESLHVYALSAEKKAITLQNNCFIPVYCLADKNMLTTVVRNLIGNAIKFTPEKGRITVDMRVNENIIIEVTDTGIGMTRENIANLFKLETHRSSQGTSGESGTGLGLLICKEFIDMHKGKIEVDSIPDKGSTFRILLPGK